MFLFMAVTLLGILSHSILDAYALSSMTVNRTGFRNASGYNYILNLDTVSFDNMTWSSTDSNWRKVTWSDDRYPIIYYHASLSGTKTHTLGNLTCRFSDAAVSYDNQSYDLVLTISNIKVKQPEYYHTTENIYRPILLRQSRGNGVQIEARQVDPKATSGNFSERTNGLTTTCQLTYKLVKSGTNTAASGAMLLGYRDLDVVGTDGTYSGGPANGQEGISIQSGGLGKSWVQSNTVLKIMDNGATYTSTRETTSSAEMDRSTVSFLGSAAGTRVLWGGTTCSTSLVLDVNGTFPKYTVTPTKEGPGTITPSSKVTVNQGMNQSVTMKANAHAHIEKITVDGKAISITNDQTMTYTFSNIRANHTIHVVFKTDTFGQKTQVRWQNADGSWTNYQVVDSKTIAYGSPYSYTWVRNKIKNEPVAIYKDGAPNPVGATSVTGSATYSINVGRKQYTYDFNLNLPSGHKESEVSNVQPDLINKYAETMSGAAKSPSLTGYLFRGWNTKADGSGSAYTNEKMLSNKTFYAQWDASEYIVRYDDNGDQNPDHLEGEFTQNKVTTVSGMPDSIYRYDTTGTLRKNDFIREGYTFIGWNTEKDGSGTSYPDEYDQVHNLTAVDGGVVTLYAQWEKLLGTETITVVSEETGNPVKDVSMELYRKVNGTWEEVSSGVTDENGQVTVTDLHWFDYKWQSIEVPAGYQAMDDTNFSITPDQLSQENDVVLYLKRVSIRLNSQVSDIIDGENPPSFLYEISGTDAAGVKHTYHVMVETDVSGTGQNEASDLFAGTYTIIQIPVQRYVPGPAEDLGNVSVSGINGTADVLHHTKAEVLFPYTISQYGGFSHTDGEINALDF